MEQNETGYQALQGPVLCVNNCGFFGTAATMNMCSKCYKDMMLKQEQSKLAASSIENIMNGTPPGSGKGSDVTAQLGPSQAVAMTLDTPAPADDTTSEKVKEGPSRCHTCRKRVGLTGFNCRCGHMFCAAHRYSDKHDCSFDYHAAAQDAIAKANPVVKADKLDKI